MDVVKRSRKVLKNPVFIWVLAALCLLAFNRGQLWLNIALIIEVWGICVWQMWQAVLAARARREENWQRDLFLAVGQVLLWIGFCIIDRNNPWILGVAAAGLCANLFNFAVTVRRPQ